MVLEPSFIGIFLMVIMGVGSFLLGRWLSRGWRDRRRAKDIAAARAKLDARKRGAEGAAADPVQGARPQRRARGRREGRRG